MSTERVSAETQAGACSYVLLMLLQRLEAKHGGLLDELIAGARADQAAMSAAGAMTEPVQNIFSETLTLLRQARG